ncbi:MAG: hypothetical protein AAF513_17575 [Pseudomonadota bacterium]
MPDLHIDDFFRDAAKTIVQLYRVFPRPVTVYVEDISGPDQPDEYGVHGPRYQACFATFQWLQEAGFIGFQDTIGADAIDQAVITPRCFAKLQTFLPDRSTNNTLPPSVQQERATRIYQLQRAVQDKSLEAQRDGIQKLLDVMT